MSVFTSSEELGKQVRELKTSFFYLSQIAQARTLRRTPRTLPPLLKLLDSSHFAYCASLLALVRALMNYGTPIRFHDSGRAALGLIDLFCVVTRCVTYLSDEAVELVAKASKLVESLQRKDGKAQEKFCEFLQVSLLCFGACLRGH